MSTILQPPPAPATAKPFSRKRYLFPLVILVAGLLLAAFAGSRIAKNVGGSGQDLAGPGERVLDLKVPGKYRIWLVTRGIRNGSFQALPDTLPAGARVTVTTFPEGQMINQSPSSSISVEMNGHRRVGLSVFSVPEPGKYRIVSEGTDTAHLLYVDAAWSFGEFFKSIAFGVAAVVLVMTGGIWAIILLIVSSSRR